MTQARKRRLIAFSTVVWAMVFSAALCWGQTGEQWTSLSGNDGKLLVSVPSDFLVDVYEGTKTIHAFTNGTTITIESRAEKKPKSYVKDSYYPKGARSAMEQLELGEFLIWKTQYLEDEAYTTIVRIGSQGTYYGFTTRSKSKSDPVVSRFLGSIDLAGTRPFKDQAASGPVDGILHAIDQLSVSKEVAAALRRSNGISATGRLATVKEKVLYDFDGFSRALIILRKPRPAYTEEARQSNKQGTIKAKVQFLKTGQIGEIIVDPALDRGLATNVGNAIAGIKFIPAEVNGKPVDVVRVLEYSFAIY
jgi:hypothetical protein